MDSKNVLLVDDEPHVLKAVARTLKNEPYRLLTAENGRAALGVMNENPVHVVLTDLSMPEMDGLELLRTIALAHPSTVRLIVSGLSDSGTILRAMETGNIYRYISKPWNDTELKLLIRQALDYHALNEERQQLLHQLTEQNAALEIKVEERTRQMMESMGMAMIGTHTAHIVHNLNNTLSNISGLFFLIKEGLTDDPPDMDELAGHCADGMHCAEKMRNIIAEIMNRSRHEDPLYVQDVDINAIIREEDRFFSMDSHYAHTVRRNLRLCESLPYFKGNPLHIKQILDNLVKNAVDAMEFTARKELTLETAVSGSSIVLKITDSGEGIEADRIDRIFESGYTTKQPGKGTGLGLASVKSMVESCGGDITVSSEPGKGTCFEVILPFSKSFIHES